MILAKNSLFRLLIWLGVAAGTVCCEKNEPPHPEPPPQPPPVDSTKYSNPVFKPIMADPTVVKDPASANFYVYGTEDFWSTDGKVHLIAIASSKDLVEWKYVGDAFTSKPGWKPGGGGLWAPDVVRVDGKYYLYYSFSTWGDPDPGIGLAISDKPEGPFIDQGKMFLSSEINVPNSIDPFYYEDNGVKYMFWGSYANVPNNGIWGVPLAADGKSITDKSEKFRIAAGDFEGTVIHKRGEYYYFFGSKNNCCDGANSIYQVQVGRSKDLKGPYVDRNGNELIHPGNGTMVLQRNSKFAGPGHASRIITDKAGNDFILYHAMDVNNAVINGVNQRALFIDKVNWDAAGWPTVHDGFPSVTPQPKPKF